MDFLALGLLLFICALIVGALSGDWVQWVREEWRLIRSYRWTHDEVEQPFTSSHPDVQRTILRLADAKKRMHRERIPTLLGGRPGWRKIVRGDAPQRPATVTQLRRNPR